MPRKYTKVDQYREQILNMKAEGKTSREIAESLGLERETVRPFPSVLVRYSLSH